MPVNDFKAFATGELANVLSQPEYEDLEALGTGFQSGIARSEELNKVWRQASTIASVVASFMATKSGNDVLDNGDLNSLQATLLKALLNNSTSQLDGRYLKATANLSELTNAGTARGNLGLKGAAVLDVGTVAATVAAGNDARIVNALQKGNNLADVMSVVTARSNLGLKGASVLDTGTTANSVAAGDDSRIVNAVPNARKVNGHALTGDINVTSQDIFNGQTIAIGSGADLKTYTIPGLYFQSMNAQAAAGSNYPEPIAGSLEVIKHAGITQVYRTYSSSRCYIRSLYGGSWSGWAKVYDTSNKPTAAEVGALPASGGRLTGNIELFTPAPIIQLSETDTGKKYFIVADGSGFRVNEDSTGGNNIISYAGGSKVLTSVGQVVPGNYTNFDNRYQLKGNYTPTGTAYTKAESDGRFALKGTSGTTTTGTFSAYYKHANGQVFMQVIGGIASNSTSNPDVVVTLPASFAGGILGIGASYTGSGGNDSDSWWTATASGKNQIKLHTRNCNGTWSFVVAGY